MFYNLLQVGITKINAFLVCRHTRLHFNCFNVNEINNSNCAQKINTYYYTNEIMLMQQHCLITNKKIICFVVPCFSNTTKTSV